MHSLKITIMQDITDPYQDVCLIGSEISVLHKLKFSITVFMIILKYF